MPSNEFLLKDAQGLELEIERHCVGLGLDCKDESQVRQFVHEMLQNMEQLKEAANQGDRTARAKVEMYGMNNQGQTTEFCVIFPDQVLGESP